jgi:plasmid replication initiation protein
MDSFNEYLGYFLTDCRNNALEELRYNKRYIELKQAWDELRAKLETLISPEAVSLLEEYAIAGLRVNGMEYDRVLLCGMTVLTEIQKRLDIYTPEYKALMDEYLS